MRALWKGAISFGLVYVPVKLYAATENKDIRFNYLHAKCKHPVQYKRFCSHCETEVTMEEIVKGYEYEKGKYVIIKDEDFSQLPSNEHRSVSILDFVNLQEIDPVYYEKAYYLAPGDGGQKVFHLLKTAMEQTGKVAVAKVIIRTKPSLAVLRVAQDIMMMNTMFYPDEVRQAGKITELNYQVELHDNELKMAVNLINNLSSEFKAEQYTNAYRQGMMDIIQAKITGEKVDDVVATPNADKVVDLMAALKASIDLAKEEREAPKKNAKRKKTS